MVELIESKSSELRVICERHHVERLALFGSALRNDFDPDKSDRDFAVEFPSMSPSEHSEASFGFLEDLESLFERSVDFVEISAVRNPYLLREIEERQETLYAAA